MRSSGYMHENITERVWRTAKNVKMNHSGTALIEAAIYFPIIIIAAMSIIMILFFKLDKIVTQAETSCMAFTAQEKIDTIDRNLYRYEIGMMDDTQVDKSHVIGSVQESPWGYYWQNNWTAFPVESYSYKAEHGKSFMSMLSSSTAHAYLVSVNPLTFVSALDDAKLLDSSVLKDKTGCDGQDYMKKQYLTGR